MFVRKLFVVRHAKSSWAQPGLADRERPLNPRGIRNAHEMAWRLHKRGVKITRLICSPARRARETAEHFAEVLDIPANRQSIEERLYEAGVDEWLRLIRGLDASLFSVMMIGHNPAITQLTNRLGHSTSNVPTCGILECQHEKAWGDFGNENDRMMGLKMELDFPKKRD